MKNRTLALIVCATILAFSVVAADSPKITASNSAELNASDLAHSLGVQWFSYKLHFDKPVSGVTVALCELRRGVDGTWQKIQLGGGFGTKHETADIQEIPVAIYIHTKLKVKDRDVTMRVGDIIGNSGILKKADFSHTYSTPKSTQFVNGCLALAIEEKDPSISTGLEKNMVRIIALEIETE